MKLSDSFECVHKNEIVKCGYNVRVEKHDDRNFYLAEIWANGKINAGYDTVKMYSAAHTSEKEISLWIKTFTEKLLKFVTGE